ncbi:MAG: beta-lactamase family protein [Saprospiraceae bacterium]|nr:beta-lactamase family protein [Saprospiraceae bacterium]
MKKKWHLGFQIYWVIFVVLPFCNFAQNNQLLRQEIEKIIEFDTDIGSDDMPDFILGIIDHDSVYKLVFQDTLHTQLSDSSIFELGGLTKVFIADMCYKLSDEKKIDLQAKINDYLPVPVRNRLLDDILVKNLLTHTSGFINRPANLGEREVDHQDPYAHYSKSDLLNYLPSIDIRMEIGTYIYSHINYALLEIILEEATGQTLSELLNQYIFKAKGMPNTFFQDLNKYPTQGYDRAGREADLWHFQSFAASEGLKSTCGDLTNYMRKQLMDQQVGQFKRLLIPQVQLEGSKNAFVADGWHLFKNKRPGNLYLHSGKTTGHAASIHFIVETKTAVVLLTNSPVNMDGLATLVLRMINDNWRRKK